MKVMIKNLNKSNVLLALYNGSAYESLTNLAIQDLGWLTGRTQFNRGNIPPAQQENIHLSDNIC